MNIVILRSLVAVVKWQTHLILVYIHTNAERMTLKVRAFDCYGEIERKNVQKIHHRFITRREPSHLI